MLRIEMLQAAHGDCLWLEYGEPGAVRRVLIDGGPYFVYDQLIDRIRALPLDDRHFELLVVTHIDTDHIDGIIRLLQEQHLGATFGEIWFNGWPQLVPPSLGAKQGEYLASVILDLEEASGKKLWNSSFDGRAVRAGAQQSLDGGLDITVLGPTSERLDDLRDHWPKVLEDVGWKPGDRADAAKRLRADKKRHAVLESADAAIVIESEPDLPVVATLGSGKPGSDTSVANGSSISMLVERAGARMLLVGDAFAADIEAAVSAELGEGERFEVDVFKLPHHGSISNVTSSMLSSLSCKHYLVSTSGGTFKHPDGAAIDLVLKHHDETRGTPELHFNYLSDTTKEWGAPSPNYVAHHEAGALELGE